MNPLQAPMDYWGQLQGADPGAAVEKAIQSTFAQRAAGAQYQMKLQQQQKLEAAREAAIKNPSAESFNALFVLDPEHHDAIKSAWQAKDADTQKAELQELSALRGLVKAGRPQEAQARIQRRIDADKKAGQDTADDQEMFDLIGEDPDGAGGYIDYMLAGVMGPDKWSEAFGKIGDADRADAKLPGEIKKTVAEATQAQAGAAKTLSEAAEVAPNAASARQVNSAQVANYQSAIQDRVNRLDLDRDTLETNTGLKLEELRAKGVEMSGVAEKSMTDAVVSAEASRQLASRATTLADQLKAADGASGGWIAAINQGWTATSGRASPVRELRRQYDALMVTQAIKNLPPGPASDKDVKMAQKGFPPANADVETMQSFLRGMAKLQTVAANREQGRADWISENGNLGTAKRDLTVNGVKVPAGSTYADFSASQSSIERRDAVADRPYMRFGNGGR